MKSSLGDLVSAVSVNEDNSTKEMQSKILEKLEKLHDETKKISCRMDKIENILMEVRSR